MADLWVPLLALELSKRRWHQTRNDGATAAHGVFIVALSLGAPGASVGARLALVLSLGGLVLSRLTIDRRFWRRPRWRRWDLRVPT